MPKQTNNRWTKTGKTNLKKKQSLSWKKYAPFIVIMALVGGFFVWRSFAATKLYSYQYSVQQCDALKADQGGKTTNTLNPDDGCLAKSAEALVYRMYEGVFGRVPDKSGYQYYTQKLAGDRYKPSEISKTITKSSEANYGALSNEEFVVKAYRSILGREPDTSGKKYWLGQLNSGKKSRQYLINNFAGVAKITATQAATKLGRPTNEDFVKEMYLGLLGRKADSGGLKYWKGQLDANKKSRADIVAYFATQDESVKAHKAGFVTFLQTAPKLTIKETAKKKQEERLYVSAARVNDAKKEYESIKGYVGYAKTRRDASKSLAAKSKPARADLTAIANHQKFVQGYKNKVPDVQRKVALWSERNTALYKEAKAVSDYSPDLSSSEIKKNSDKVVYYLALTKNINTDLSNLIKEISAQYKVAEGKYEAEQRRLAEEAARKAAEDAARKKQQKPAGGGTTPTTGGGTTPTTGGGDTQNCDNSIDYLFAHPDECGLTPTS